VLRFVKGEAPRLEDGDELGEGRCWTFHDDVRLAMGS
jgi:hypothetical protein